MKNRKVLIFVWLIAVLALVNYGVYKNEKHLSTGTPVCLELAPIDPRSMMQGDYMALRFALSDTIMKKLPDSKGGKSYLRYGEGYAVLKLEDNCTTSFVRLSDTPVVTNDTISLFYRIRNHTVKFATNAYFFQEGTANKYTNAKYGVFKVNKKGEPLLYGLKDKELKTLGEAR